MKAPTVMRTGNVLFRGYEHAFSLGLAITGRGLTSARVAEAVARVHRMTAKPSNMCEVGDDDVIVLLSDEVGPRAGTILCQIRVPLRRAPLVNIESLVTQSARFADGTILILGMPRSSQSHSVLSVLLAPRDSEDGVGEAVEVLLQLLVENLCERRMPRSHTRN